MDKNHKGLATIDLNEPRHAQYMHKASKKHLNTENWVDINLSLKKGLKFFQTRSNAIILQETLPVCCIPKVVMMESGELIFEKVYASPSLPPKISWKMTGWKNWVQKLLNDQMDRLFNNPKVLNQANQIQTQIMMIERWNPLFAATQVSRKVTSSQCWTRWTWTSEFQGSHILPWRMRRVLAFVNCSRRSRTTLTDNLFNEINNKTKPTARSVRRQSKWFRMWAK